tara:strand:+ start:134 stop:337 length:204 start_codon:yes stop_codon:yes gene_type:complete
MTNFFKLDNLYHYLALAGLFLAIHVPMFFGRGNPMKTGGGCPLTPMMMYGLSFFMMGAFALFFQYMF